MPARNNVRITSYKIGLEMLGVPYDQKAISVFNELLADGHTEKSICFSIFKTYDKLAMYVGDNRFWSIFKNEVLKWSWPRNDPRWEEYNKRKAHWAEIKKKELEMREYATYVDKLKKISKDRGKYPGFIYFIQGENGGPIKIGYTTNVFNRLKELQTGHPDTLKVLTMFPGNVAMEKIIHKDLKAYWLRGEWFKPDPYVLKRMERYRERAIELSKSKR